MVQTWKISFYPSLTVVIIPHFIEYLEQEAKRRRKETKMTPVKNYPLKALEASVVDGIPFVVHNLEISVGTIFRIEFRNYSHFYIKL
jgi:hypothetical protein